MKILITGAKGLLGSNLAFIYSKNHEIYATGKNKPNFKNCFNYELDITKKEDIKIIEKIKPEVVIHCAALTNLDFCEENKKIAENINSEGTKNIAKICDKIGCYLVHISTDGIFDGKKGNYSERDIPCPINIYGKTKLMAEEQIKKINKKYLILRTTIYGWNSQDKFSLAEWMLDKLKKKEKFSGFEDIYFSPILVNNLARVILELISKKYNGVLNITGSETCSRLEFAKKIAKIFELNESLIYPLNSERINFKAKRGKNLSLDIGEAKKILQTSLLGVEESLKEFKELRDNGFVEELKRQNI